MGTPSERVQKWAKKERERLMKEGGGKSSFTAWRQTPKSKAVDEKKYKKKSKAWLADKNKVFKQQPIRPAHVGATASILRKTDKTGDKGTYDYEGPGGMAPERKPLKSASKKTVKQKTTTYQGKKGDTIKPKVKESTKTGMVAPKKYRELYKKKSKAWLADKAKRKTDNTVQKQAQRETDSTVQKQIKSGFGDWSSSDDFGKKIKSDFAKKKKRILSGFDKNKREQESSFEKKKREMKASFEKKKIRLGG
jgi:hypothetical protein